MVLGRRLGATLDGLVSPGTIGGLMSQPRCDLFFYHSPTWLIFFSSQFGKGERQVGGVPAIHLAMCWADGERPQFSPEQCQKLELFKFQISNFNAAIFLT